MLQLKTAKTDFRGGLQLASTELLTNFRPVWNSTNHWSTI